MAKQQATPLQSVLNIEVDKLINDLKELKHCEHFERSGASTLNAIREVEASFKVVRALAIVEAGEFNYSNL